MSILIKGIDLPKDFWYLDLVITADGVVRYYGDEDYKIAEAIELPDHGDLIDRDALNATDSWEWIRHDAPVVIPAERSEASLCDNCDWKNEKGCCWCKRMERSEE